MKKGVIIAILLAVTVSVGLFFAPITPDKKEAVDPQTESLDLKVDEAVLIIQSAEGAPMRGIAMLREVLSEDPNHVKANYWMGEFSWISEHPISQYILTPKLHEFSFILGNPIPSFPCCSEPMFHLP